MWRHCKLPYTVIQSTLNSTLLDRLQKAQNAYIRYVFILKIYDHVTTFY